MYINCPKKESQQETLQIKVKKKGIRLIGEQYL